MPISQTSVLFGDHYYQVFEQPEGIEWKDAKIRSEPQGDPITINDAEDRASSITRFPERIANHFI